MSMVQKGLRMDEALAARPPQEKIFLCRKVAKGVRLDEALAARPS